MAAFPQLENISYDIWTLIIPHLALKDAGQLAQTSRQFRVLVKTIAWETIQRILKHPHMQITKELWSNKFAVPGNLTHLELISCIYQNFQKFKSYKIPINIPGKAQLQISSDPSSELFNYPAFEKVYQLDLSSRFKNYRNQLNFRVNFLKKGLSQEASQKISKLMATPIKLDLPSQQKFIKKLLKYLNANKLLTYAASTDYWEIIPLLVEHGADLDLEASIAQKWHKHALKKHIQDSQKSPIR